MTDRLHAPWSEAQIAALNAYQRSGRMHPFTCGNEQHELHQTLIAERDGWRCPDEQCDYRQTWAHAVMADPAALEAMALPWPEPSDEAKAAAAQQLALSYAGQLRIVRQQLRATEDDLGRERQHTARLAQQLEAEMQRTEALRIELRMLNAIRKDPDGGMCDPTPHEKPTTVAGSIDNWKERTGA